ncbi:MAG: LysM peptidoglycan-binding domain-containing protein [Halobacteriovoraceae bacterium]|nr:LysM peptidoglycan-binding domain-containing protein [Halobacteriovoraceae bacterium]MBT5095315.1 LysM peptidoglycan-binding domain-containing protein [Halobacteriovoraceae bacterium]
MKKLLLCAVLFGITTIPLRAETQYRVEKNDTLQNISFAHYNTYRCWDIIVQNNPSLPNPNNIEPGTTLNIPASSQCRFLNNGTTVSQVKKVKRNYKSKTAKKIEGDVTGYLAETSVDNMIFFDESEVNQKHLGNREKKPADFKYRRLYRDPELQKKRMLKRKIAQRKEEKRKRKAFERDMALRKKNRIYKEKLLAEQREKDRKKELKRQKEVARIEKARLKKVAKLEKARLKKEARLEKARLKKVAKLEKARRKKEARLEKLRIKEEARMAKVRKAEQREEKRQQKEIAFQALIAKSNEEARQAVILKQKKVLEARDLAHKKKLNKLAHERNQKKSEAREIQIKYMQNLNAQKQAILLKKIKIDRLEKEAMARAEKEQNEKKRLKLIALEKSYLKKAIKEIAAPAKIAKSRKPASFSSSKKSLAIKKVTKHIYTIQLASYQDINQASDLQRKLILGGYEARIEKATLEKDSTWYRVRLGKFKNRNQAAGFASMADFQVFAGQHIILKVPNSGI